MQQGMWHMTTLDRVLDAVMELDRDQQDMLIDILRRRQIEDRRTQIAEAAREARAAYHAGELHPETADDLIRRLQASLEADDDNA
jgi:hypothetical protein